MDEKKNKDGIVEVIQVDCLGDMCPLPMMKLQKKEETLNQGLRIMLVTDHSCASENIMEYCRLKNYKYQTEEPISGVWEITIEKDLKKL